MKSLKGRILADKELAIEALKEMLKKIQSTSKGRIYL